MLEKYDQSIQALQLYMNITKLIPSEKEWNRFAMGEKLLSSQSIQYLSQSGFNKLCRKLIKNKIVLELVKFLKQCNN